ncbi:MAG: 4Fe-4S binding protein [Verrucomicrobiae bacterium]|nr:4Fe-4S binding protein [Verrucomicrobiae bacterium]
MRLSHFLTRRGAKPGRNREPRRALLHRVARKWLPGFLFSTGDKPGGARRGLRRLGPSWESAPLRRVIQTACFVLFCLLLLYVCWPYSVQPDGNASGWPSHYADGLQQRESIDAELFLTLDPLVGISTAVAGRTWNWALLGAGVILVVGILIPRGFCGYLCPLGTLIDLFDFVVGRRVRRHRVAERGWWVHLKYYLLTGTLVAAACGTMVAGYFAAIPVVTRGFAFFMSPLQLGMERGWHQVPALTPGHLISGLLLLLVLALGFLGPRFWCRYVCPTGAVFSLGNRFVRASERKVENSCIDCGRCVAMCPFDAIKPDFTTRVMDCTLCQTCGGVCPTKAIKFVDRWNSEDLRPESWAGEIPVSRRGFLGGIAGGLAGVLGIRSTFGGHAPPVRPPMSVPEPQFLELCIRCGECFQACPNSVLQPMTLEAGLDGLWTPRVTADWSGCEPSCNNCGQVCPTGAIRPLPLEEKRVARMGLAEVKASCLPWAGTVDCQLCVDECHRAGYDAIEFQRVHTEVNPDGVAVEGTGLSAPVVLVDRCVGCGLCQSVCHRKLVKAKGVLESTAIVVHAGPGKEDRLIRGSYLQLRKQEEEKRRKESLRKLEELGDFY